MMESLASSVGIPSAKCTDTLTMFVDTLADHAISCEYNDHKHCCRIGLIVIPDHW